MITIHAKEQYQNRILPYVGKQISMSRLNDLTNLYPKGKHYVRIANLPRIYTAADGSRGDTVVAIVNDGSVITLMLSMGGQRWPDGTFRVRLIA